MSGSPDSTGIKDEVVVTLTKPSGEPQTAHEIDNEENDHASQ